MSKEPQGLAGLSPERLALYRLLAEERRKLKNPARINPVGRAELPQSFPLSYAQQRLWVLDRLFPGSAAYNIPAGYRLRGDLSFAALQDAFSEIVRRHESLRTTFTSIAGRPMQTVQLPSPYVLSSVDLTALPDKVKSELLQQIKIEQGKRPFCLDLCPLIRLTSVKLEPDEYELVITIHHIISDGWSMSLLMGEAASLYHAFSKGAPSSLPELDIQYADFVLWHRKSLNDERLNELLDYWKQNLLEKTETLNLPTDRPRGAERSSDGASHEMLVSPALLDSLRQLSRREGVTLFMTLLAAFKTLLFRYTGQENIVLGSPIANREQAETERLIGFFVNMLALRTEVSGHLTFRQLLARVRDVTMGAYSHQDLPFEMLVDALNAGRSLTQTPVFQVVFALQNMPRSEPQIHGLAIEPLVVDFSVTMFDLILGMAPSSKGLEGSFLYNTSLFDADTISRMSQHYMTVLEAIAAGVDIRLAEIPLTGAPETDPASRHKASIIREQYEMQNFEF